MSSSFPSQNPEVTLSLSFPSIPTNRSEDVNPEERGIKLIELLLSCAGHTSSGNLHHADACLRQILQHASINGDSMQRLSARFASALAARLVKRWPGLYKALNNTKPAWHDLDRAWSIFTQQFPCMAFAYSIIKQVLIQVMSHERIIHIIDLGSGDPNLWVPFIQGLGHVPDGSPHLRITFVSQDKVAQENIGARLVKEAESLDLPFQFNPVNVSLTELTLDMLKVKSGEALALISISSLHALLAEDDRVNSHFGSSKNNGVKDSKQMNEFLAMVKSMSPKVVLLVEQESDHNHYRLVDRFVEALHYYSAWFDSISVAYGEFSCTDRTMLEDMFGNEIENIVAGEGLEREKRHERYAKWMVRFGGAGFKPVRLWSGIMDEARIVVEAYGLKGYKIINEKASLMICWHDRPIYAVSAWTCFS
ncbi:Hypothetical predicted protein [Olea europaea subsp. europaea]|uniref:Scarecrow-like protein 3 n=1 Tax=Olea europaea subsp. europaea TaxID=158383 RepID=A0A8S0U8S4_OLEEU|nr:Hypothetical predicted protein [Olea europaea subsp. europaea]